MLPKFDFHVHTHYSDGVTSPGEMVESAVERGLEAMAITDHGPEHFDGVLPGRLDRMLSDAQIAKENADFPVVLGMEANILEGGSIDIGKDITERLDLVVAGVHETRALPELPELVARDYLDLAAEAIDGCEIDVLAHPFYHCRDFSSHLDREDLAEFVELMVDRGVAVEVNERYRAPSEEFLSLCVAEGAKISVGSDAHSPGEVGQLRWTMKSLKLAGVEREDLILDEFL